MGERRSGRRTLRAITLATVLVAQGVALVSRVPFATADRTLGSATAEVLLSGVRGLPPAGPPEIVGTLEGYGPGTLVVLTPIGLQRVLLDAETVVVRPHGPGVAADLRPGAVMMVWGRRSVLGNAVRARAVLVTDS